MPSNSQIPVVTGWEGIVKVVPDSEVHKHTSQGWDVCTDPAKAKLEARVAALEAELKRHRRREARRAKARKSARTPRSARSATR